MATERRSGFYGRAFVTFYIVLALLVIAVSGVVLYVAPPGRIANWSNWRLGVLTKAQWQSLHTVFALTFIIAVAFHLWFNWRVILNYVRTAVGLGMRRKWELVAAVLVGGLLLAGTVWGVPPFSTIMALGETAKNSWSSPSVEPPIPHAEELTLATLAKSTGVSGEQILANLERAGIGPATTDSTLAQLGARHGLTPREVYAKAVGGAAPAAAGGGEGGGFGRRTVAQMATEANLTVETALARLREAGVVDATAESTMRELASRTGRRPSDVAAVIRGAQATGER